MANGHGSARAGRKPKALRYEEQVTAVEERIVQMLPRLVEKLYEMAMDGDLRANRYLIDRIMGRVPALVAAPSTDRSIPYGDREFAIEKLGHSLKLEKDELRFERERDEIFECEDEDEDKTYDELISASPEETDDLSLSGASPALRALLEDKDPPSTSPICPIEKTLASTRSTVDRPPRRPSPADASPISTRRSPTSSLQTRYRSSYPTVPTIPSAHGTPRVHDIEAPLAFAPRPIVRYPIIGEGILSDQGRQHKAQVLPPMPANARAPYSQ